jgi:hypothetical protein
VKALNCGWRSRAPDLKLLNLVVVNELIKLPRQLDQSFIA